MTSSRPHPLKTSFVERIWGTTRLLPWFPDTDRKIGEVWLTADPPLPILVKFIFTSARLSVQVHPDDEYARAHEDSAGKTEMWHILRAEPGAQIALGFRDSITASRLREAATSPEIEGLLNWVDARPGDTFLVPAGTVHAIGKGLVLCEIQQNSDITYRLYDYGRGRQLHLDKGVAASHLGPHPGKQDRQGDVLASCPYFQTELVRLEESMLYLPDPGRFQLLIVIGGRGRIGGEPFAAGEGWYVPPGDDPIIIEGSADFLRTFVP